MVIYSNNYFFIRYLVFSINWSVVNERDICVDLNFLILFKNLFLFKFYFVKLNKNTE